MITVKDSVRINIEFSSGKYISMDIKAGSTAELAAAQLRLLSEHIEKHAFSEKK